jgi:hypothetical protein
MSLENCEKKRPWPVLRFYTEIHLDDLREIIKGLMITCHYSDNRIPDLLDLNLAPKHAVITQDYCDFPRAGGRYIFVPSG